MAKFVVTYWELNSVERLVEADTREEAVRKMQEAVSGGRINASYANLEDNGYEAVKATGKDEAGVEELEE